MKILLTVLFLTLSFSCGIKGPPLPPIETVGDKLNSMPTQASGTQTVSSDNSKRESTK